MIHNRPKRTISTSSGLGLLQMVLELDIRQCGSKDCEIPHQLKRGTNIVRSHLS